MVVVSRRALGIAVRLGIAVLSFTVQAPALIFAACILSIFSGLVRCSPAGNTGECQRGSARGGVPEGECQSNICGGDVARGPRRWPRREPYAATNRTGLFWQQARLRPRAPRHRALRHRALRPRALRPRATQGQRRRCLKCMQPPHKNSRLKTPVSRARRPRRSKS